MTLSSHSSDKRQPSSVTVWTREATTETMHWDSRNKGYGIDQTGQGGQTKTQVQVGQDWVTRN